MTPSLPRALALTLASAWLVLPARAAPPDPCKLLTPAEVAAAIGLKVSAFAQPQGARNSPFCEAQAGTTRVMLRVAEKAVNDPAATTRSIEAAQRMGAKIELKKFGAISCSTLIPPAQFVEHMGFNTTCSATKGTTVAAVEVVVKSQPDMISVQRLRVLAKKMAARL